MFSWFIAASEALLLFPIAFAASWTARTGIRTLTRSAVRRAQRVETSSWRVRLDRLGDDGQSDTRRRQRADAVARMIGHIVTAFIVAVAAVIQLNLLGVDAVFAISSAGFVGFAIALSAQDFVKDFLTGVRVLLEDRYAVGDVVTLVVSGNEVRGTVDLIGAASVRLRTPDGATWHAGHHVIESITNESQLPTVTGIDVPLAAWTRADADAASERLARSSNDVGLTGVVFVGDIEAHTPTADDRRSATAAGSTAVLDDVPTGTANVELDETARVAGTNDDGDDSIAALAVDPTCAVQGKLGRVDEAGNEAGDDAKNVGDAIVTVAVRSNRPLSASQTELVRDRLLGH